jgi:hypothetical protein
MADTGAADSSERTDSRGTTSREADTDTAAQEEVTTGDRVHPAESQENGAVSNKRRRNYFSSVVILVRSIKISQRQNKEFGNWAVLVSK